MRPILLIAVLKIIINDVNESKVADYVKDIKICCNSEYFNESF